MATSIVSLTITKAFVFSWLRNFMEHLSEYLGKLFKCALCMSYYAGAFFFFPIYFGTTHFHVIDRSMVWIEVPTMYFSIICLANLFTGIIFHFLSKMK